MTMISDRFTENKEDMAIVIAFGNLLSRRNKAKARHEEVKEIYDELLSEEKTLRTLYEHEQLTRYDSETRFRHTDDNPAALQRRVEESSNLPSHPIRQTGSWVGVERRFNSSDTGGKEERESLPYRPPNADFDSSD